MAVFSASAYDRINSIQDKKLQSYLYKLNEDLTYMFNNLTPEDNYSSSAQISYAKIVYNDKIVAEINASEEGLTILADKISLEGLVTVNGYFKVLEDGSIEAVNGKFSGTITASTINTSTIYSTEIYGGDDIPFECRKGRVSIGDFYVDDEYGRHILQSSDEATGMSTGDASGGEFLLWAGWGMSSEGDAFFSVNTDGRVDVYGSLYVNGKKIA